MGVSSVTIGGLEVIDTADYFVSQSSLTALMSLLVPVEPLLAEMAGRHPHLTGWVPKERSFTITVGFIGSTINAREDLYMALLTAIATRYVPLTWTVNGDTRTMYVLCTEAPVEPWYRDVAIAMLAPDPVAT